MTYFLLLGCIPILFQYLLYSNHVARLFFSSILTYIITHYITVIFCSNLSVNFSVTINWNISVLRKTKIL